MITKELVEQWAWETTRLRVPVTDIDMHIAQRAAAYGAEQREMELLAASNDELYRLAFEYRASSTADANANYNALHAAVAAQLAAARLQGAKEEKRRAAPEMLRLYQQSFDDGWKAGAGKGAAVNQGLTDAQYYAIGQMHWLTSAKVQAIHEEIQAAIAAASQGEQEIVTIEGAPKGEWPEADQGEQASKPLTRLESECKRIGEEVQRAASELPEGYELEVYVEQGYGCVYLHNPSADVTCFNDTVDGLSHCITQAIEAAIKEQAT